MSIIQFSAQPLPYYINSGFSWAGPGRKHPERYAIGEFDLIVVMRGCLYIGEEDRRYEVSEGHALILRPDLHHYPTAGCGEQTASFWLHFHTTGRWRMADGTVEREDELGKSASFQIRIPQFARLLHSSRMYECLRKLNALEKDSHFDWIRWRQQVLFQEVLMLLGEVLTSGAAHSGAAVADQAASYLREHYRGQVSTRELSNALNFHPVYIARCMKKQFHCSPMEYLMRYRLEQAKLLLLQTDLPVNRIAQETGFNQAAYFTSCFGRWEGSTPRQYRQRLIQKEAKRD